MADQDEDPNLLHLDRAADRHGVPRAVLRSLASVESRSDPMAVSHAGAVGMMQIMPSTAVELGFRPSEMFEPDKAAEAGARYVKRMYDRFGNWDLAVQAYNAGPARVAYRLRQGIPLPRETVTHLERVKAQQAAAALARRAGGD